MYAPCRPTPLNMAAMILAITKVHREMPENREVSQTYFALIHDTFQTLEDFLAQPCNYADPIELRIRNEAAKARIEIIQDVALQESLLKIGTTPK